jgi:hypothetical protein
MRLFIYLFQLNVNELWALPPKQLFTGIGSVKTNDSTSRNVHAIPILRGRMRNNSQKQYNIRVTILHGEEKNGTQRFIGGSKERRRISGWSTKVKPSGALH